MVQEVFDECQRCKIVKSAVSFIDRETNKEIIVCPKCIKELISGEENG